MTRPRTPRGRAREAATRLATEYPGTARELCALRHEGPFQLLVATILSAQTTDERVNQVTPAVFARFPTAADLAAADPAELEELVRSTGFFRSKTRSLIGMAGALTKRNAITMLMSIELMLNGVIVTMVSFARHAQTPNLIGQVWAIFVMTVAAAEAAVGLAIVIAVYRLRHTVDVDAVDTMQG